MNYKELFKKIIKEIEKANSIVILRHRKPDPDALGSQIGLSKLIKGAYPEKSVYVIGDMPENLKYIGDMDEITQEVFDNSLIIVVDCSTSRLINCPFEVNVDEVIKIDHHPNDEVYGDLVWVDTNSSSASEMIALFAFENNLDLSKEAAELLYAGIIGDTGRFLYPSTSARTFEVAGKLRQYDFDLSALSRKMDSISRQVAKLQGYVYEQLEIDENGTARVILPQDVLQAYQLTDADTAAIVGAPGRIEEVGLWAIFVEQPEGHYRVRMRSKVIPINGIAKNHHGGGHPLASGANAFSKEEIEQIYTEMKELAKK